MQDEALTGLVGGAIREILSWAERQQKKKGSTSPSFFMPGQSEEKQKIIQIPQILEIRRHAYALATVGEKNDGEFDEIFLSFVASALKNLASLSRSNLRTFLPMIEDASRLLVRRQKRLNKIQLKPKEIATAFELLSFHYANTCRHTADNELMCCFGSFPEDKALKYFEENVLGEVTDKLGRKILIDEDALRCLYKEDSEDGEHVVATENYKEHRGKRMPWIRWILQNSKEIYRDALPNSPTTNYMYAAEMCFPANGGKMVINHCVVIARKKRDQTLKLITSYFVDDHDGFLKVIERFKVDPEAARRTD